MGERPPRLVSDKVKSTTYASLTRHGNRSASLSVRGWEESLIKGLPRMECLSHTRDSWCVPAKGSRCGFAGGVFFCLGGLGFRSHLKKFWLIVVKMTQFDKKMWTVQIDLDEFIISQRPYAIRTSSPSSSVESVALPFTAFPSTVHDPPCRTLVGPSVSRGSVFLISRPSMEGVNESMGMARRPS